MKHETSCPNCQAILAAMPGSHKEIAKRVGMGMSPVYRWLCRLKDEGLAHPRGARAGAKSRRVWYPGPEGKVYDGRRPSLPPKAPVVVRVRRDPLVAAFFGAAP